MPVGSLSPLRAYRFGGVDAVAVDAGVVLALDDAGFLRGRDRLPAPRRRCCWSGRTAPCCRCSSRPSANAVSAALARASAAALNQLFVRAARRIAGARAPVDAGGVAALARVDDRCRRSSACVRTTRGHAARVVDDEQNVRLRRRVRLLPTKSSVSSATRGQRRDERPNGAQAASQPSCVFMGVIAGVPQLNASAVLAFAADAIASAGRRIDAR